MMKIQTVLLLAAALSCLYISVDAQANKNCNCKDKKDEYSPVCADNGVTYDSAAKLLCENKCNKLNTTISYYGLCHQSRSQSQQGPQDGAIPAQPFDGNANHQDENNYDGY